MDDWGNEIITVILNGTIQRSVVYNNNLFIFIDIIEKNKINETSIVSRAIKKI